MELNYSLQKYNSQNNNNNDKIKKINVLFWYKRGKNELSKKRGKRSLDQMPDSIQEDQNDGKSVSN